MSLSMDTPSPPVASKKIHRTTAPDRQVWMLSLTKAPLTAKISAANIIRKQRRSTPIPQINNHRTSPTSPTTTIIKKETTAITTARLPPRFTNELQASHFHDRRRLISFDDNDTLVDKVAKIAKAKVTTTNAVSTSTTTATSTAAATTTSTTAAISSSIPSHGIAELEALLDDPPTEEPTVVTPSLLKKIQRMKLELKTKNQNQNQNRSGNVWTQKEDDNEEEEDSKEEEKQQHQYFIQAHPYQQLMKQQQQRQQNQDQGSQARSSPTTTHRGGGSTSSSRLVRRSIRQKPTISGAQAYMGTIQSKTKTKTKTSTPKVKVKAKARKATGTASVKAKAKRPPKVTPSLKGSLPTVPVVVVPKGYGRTTIQQRSRRVTGGGGGITATAALSPSSSSSSSPLSVVAVPVVPRRRKRTPQRKRKGGGITMTNYSARRTNSTVTQHPRISDVFSPEQQQQQDQDYPTSTRTRRTRTLAECLAAFPADRRGSTASVFVPVSASTAASTTTLTRTRSQTRRPPPPQDDPSEVVEEHQHVHFISTAATAAAATTPIPQYYGGGGGGGPSCPMPWTRIIRPDFAYRGRKSHEASSTLASSSSKSSSSDKSDNDTSNNNNEDNKKPAFDESRLYNRLIQDLSRNEISIVVDVFGDQDDTDEEDEEEDDEQQTQGEDEDEEEDADDKEVRDLMMHRPYATGTIGSTLLYETHGRFFDPKRKMPEYGFPPPNYHYNNPIRRNSRMSQVARTTNTNHAGEKTSTISVPRTLQVLPPLPPRGSVPVPPHSTTCTRELNAKVVRLINNSCIAPPKGLQQLPRLSLSCSSAPTSPTNVNTMIARATDTQLFELVQMENNTSTGTSSRTTVLPPSLIRRPSSTPTLPSAASSYGYGNYYANNNRNNSNSSNSNWRYTTTSTAYGGGATTTTTTTSPLVRRQSKKTATITALTVDHGNDVINNNSNSNNIRNTAVTNVRGATTTITTTTPSPAVVGQSRHANNALISNNPDNANTNSRPRTLFNHNGFERMHTGDNTGFFDITLGSIRTNHGTEGSTENRELESRAAIVSRQMRRLGQDLRFHSSDDEVNGIGDGNGDINDDGNGDDGTTNGSSTHTTTTTTCTHAADDDDDHDDTRCMLEDTITTRLARASTKDLIAIAQNLMEEDTTSTTPTTLPTPKNNIDGMLDDEGKRIVDIDTNENEKKKKVVHASFESVAAATATWGTTTTAATTSVDEPATSGTTTTIANRKKRNRKNKMKTSHNDDDSSPSSSSLSSRPSKKKSRSLGRRRSSCSSSSSSLSSSSSHRRFLPSVRKTTRTATAIDTATGTATATSGEDEPTTILLVGPGLDHNKVTIWNRHLNEAKQFIDTYGHSRIPTNYPTNPILGGWAKRQRYQYKIYMKYSSDPNTTITTAKEARLKQETTKTTHTNNDGDGDADDDDGDDDNEDDESNMNNNVGVVRCQMNPERIQALNEIGFCLDLQVDGWEAKYQAVAVYLQLYHGMYPPNYQGSTHESDIAQWISTQRYQMTLLEQGKRSYLTPARITKLNSIHFVWRVEDGVKLTRSFKKVKKTHHDEK